MSEKIALKEIQGLEQPSAVVSLYEITLDEAAGTKIYFTRGLDSDLGTVQMYDYDTNSQLNTYQALPISVDGLEHRTTGANARPVLTVANVVNTFDNSLGGLEADDLIGKKVYRRRTFRKYLKDGSADTGSGNTPVEFPRQIYIIDRIEALTPVELSFELTSPFDVENLLLPYRVVGHNACPWLYQGASPEKSEAAKRGGCVWHTQSNYRINGVVFTVYVNEDDEYVVPGPGETGAVTFTTYSSGAVNINQYYKTSVTLGTTSGVRRYKLDGTIDTSADSSTIYDYWQATASSSSPGTPSDTNTNFQRVRFFDTWDNSKTYYAYTDDRYNDYVKYTASSVTRLWKTKMGSLNKTPEFGSYWEMGDVCGKRLTSCNKRYGFNPISANTASSTGTPKTDTSVQLPFGGFPGARKFK